MLVEDLAAAGYSRAEIARRTGVPIGTVENWLRGRLSRRARRAKLGEASCRRCGADEHQFAQLPTDTYAYLLGVYLGDGNIVKQRRCYSLRVCLDSIYPGIIREAVRAIELLKGVPPWVGRHRTDRCVLIVSYSKSWPCLFPQHGPGRKHARSIELQEWQQRIVSAAPGWFLRGLIHTDGWRGLNRVHVKGRDYAYPRYQFSNRSDDIRRLFTDACDLLGAQWRPWGRWHISVARRESVAILDSWIGLKH
jgi:transcriptional regulator with XRE-family HTH domain